MSTNAWHKAEKIIKEQAGVPWWFHKEFSPGSRKRAVHKCCVCDQLWFTHIVVIVQRNSLPDCNSVDVCLLDIHRSEGDRRICKTCLSHLKKKKIPQSSTANWTGFIEVPQHPKDLHQVEWRLVSPRIPFMKLFAAPRGGQKKIRGNVVNLPCDTVNTFQVLPHSGNEQQTIQVKIKRDLRSQTMWCHKMCGLIKYKRQLNIWWLMESYLRIRVYRLTKLGLKLSIELSNSVDVNERSLLQIGTNVGEPHIDGRAIFSVIPGEPQPGCSNWNDSLNLAIDET